MALYVPNDVNFREPCWRHQTVQRLLQEMTPLFNEHGKVREHEELEEYDDFTRTAYHFYARFETDRESAPRLKKLCKEYPWLYRTQLLTEHHNAYKRWAIEAFVVAGEPVEDISEIAALSCESEVVKWYERLFFDVREACANPSFVLFNLIPEIHQDGPSVENTAAYWKLVGAFLGADVLADIVCKFVLRNESVEALKGATMAEMIKRVAGSIGSVPIHSKNFSDVCHAMVSLRDQHRQEKIDAGVTGTEADPLLGEVQDQLFRHLKRDIASDSTAGTLGAQEDLVEDAQKQLETESDTIVPPVEFEHAESES